MPARYCSRTRLFVDSGDGAGWGEEKMSFSPPSFLRVARAAECVPFVPTRRRRRQMDSRSYGQAAVDTRTSDGSQVRERKRENERTAQAS